jgi:hypothetical protein
MDMQDYEWELQSRGYDDTDGVRVCLECVFDHQLRSNLLGALANVGEPCVGCRRQGPTVPAEEVLREMLAAVHLLYGDALGFLPVEGGEFIGTTTDAREVVEDELAGDVSDGVFAALYDFIRFDVSLARDFDEADALDNEWELLRQRLSPTVSIATSSRGDDLDIPFLLSLEGLISRNPRLIRADVIGSRYWRVREHSPSRTVESYACAREMGSPPPSSAVDNRFSRLGQSAFYAAPTASTSIAEVFQSTGGEGVLASFVSTRRLNFLDLVDLPDSPSIYDASQTELFIVLRFLKQFSKEVSLPNDGLDPTHYRATQHVTDVVRRIANPIIDGIRYVSSRDGQPSVIIFAGPNECADPGLISPSSLLCFEPDSISPVVGA